MTAYLTLTGSAAQTRRLGRRLSQQLQDGDVLLLTGDLGAGKSELMRGVAEGLGIEGPIPSPTFTLLNLYQTGRLRLHHFDWYRLQDAEEIEAAGLVEMIGGEGLTAIEWHERAPELLPEDCLEIEINQLDDQRRQIAFLPRAGFRGLDWQALDDRGEDA